MMPEPTADPGGLRVIYLGGLGRSGTTLTERLLGELPGIWPAGEVVHMWQRGIVSGERCGCGEPFPDCPFWQKVGAVGFGGWDRVDVDRVGRLRAAVDRSRYIPLLAAPALPRALRQPLAEYLSYYRRIYAAIAEISGCPVIVDSSKHASLAFCLSRCPGLDLRVIQVVRDSRAVAFSWARTVRRPDCSGLSYMTSYPAATAAMQWNVQNGALELLARSGTAAMRVRYEDLVDAPARTLAQIAGFAGVAAGPGGLPFLGSAADGCWADLGAAHTVSGNPMRFATGRIPIRRDDQWRAAMPDPQRRTVTALTFPLLARYGYARRAA